jgi:hypothetical protein
MKRILALALTLSFAACTAEPPAAPSAPTAPAPIEQPIDANALSANGWGPLRIGMTMAEITAALGPDANPNAVGGADPAVCTQFRPERAPEGMLLMVENGVLSRITLMRTNVLKTDRGFGLGDSAAAIKAAYGADAIATPHKYIGLPAEYIAAWVNLRPTEYVQDANARGIVYETDAQGIVRQTHAGGPSIQLVEGCS